MQIDKKYIKHVTWFFGLVVILANIIAVVVPTIIRFPMGDIENIVKWESFLNSNKLSNISLVAAFLVPTVFCLNYSRRNLKEDDKILKSVAEIPSVFSLSSVIGWNIYYFIEIPFVIYAKVKLGIHISYILISSWAFALISGMTAYTISFLGIELLNRTLLLPKIFPNGHIQHSKHSVNPHFSHLLVYCCMVSSVFPIGLLLANHIFTQLRNGGNIQVGLVVISSMFLFFALIITFSLSKIILNPLFKLTETARRIKDGDYKTKVDVVTADELGLLADSFNDMAASLEEKEFMRDTFGKIVDPEVRDYLMKESKGIERGGEVREVTVLFCDIRSFTSMSEKMSAQDVVSLLNRYFTALGNCITNNHGIINKYIGDSIMAIFGAPVSSINHSKDALTAAIEMRKALLEINGQFKEDGFPEIKFGIGIHTGSVFAGTIGAENRMEYTVIGDTVNTASRIESLCKTYKVDLLLSEEAVNQIKAKNENEQFKFIDNAQIRGKTEQMKVYTI